MIFYKLTCNVFHIFLILHVTYQRIYVLKVDNLKWKNVVVMAPENKTRTRRLEPI